MIDLLVIGGGINGCAVARDAAGRGLQVTLCEKDDLAAHTSSASTKLIHGGLRYLENYDFRLVRHSLKEREILLQSAPHIIWPLRFILPHHAGLRPRWLLRLGLFIYDHIGGRKLLPPSNRVDLTRHVAGQFLKPTYRSGFEYSDCAVKDARLVVLNARDAKNHGAKILTRSECIELVRHPQYWEASILQKNSGQVITVKSKALVNASGPWVQQTLGLYQKHQAARSIRLVKGSHIVVNKLFDHDYAYIFQNADGRILFAIPFEQDFTLLGTTDVDFQQDPDQVAIEPQEIDYICSAVSEYTRQPVLPEQVIWSYSGVRPLFDNDAEDASKVTRDYTLDLDREGAPIVSVYGGKVTTSRVLSEQVVDLVTTSLHTHQPAWTESATLPGGDFKSKDFAQFLVDSQSRYRWLDPALVFDYARNYGTEIDHLLAHCQQPEDLGKYFGGGLYQREVDFWIAHEWAQSSDDMLWRRSKKGLKMTPGEIERFEQWLETYTQVT